MDLEFEANLRKIGNSYFARIPMGLAQALLKQSKDFVLTIKPQS